MESKSQQHLTRARGVLGGTVLILEALLGTPLAAQEIRVRVGFSELELKAGRVSLSNAAGDSVEIRAEGRLQIRLGGGHFLDGVIRDFLVRGFPGASGSGFVFDRVDELQIALDDVTGELELFGGTLRFLPALTRPTPSGLDRHRAALLERALDPPDLELGWRDPEAPSGAGTIELAGRVRLTSPALRLAGSVRPLEAPLCGPVRLSHDPASSTVEPLELDLSSCDAGPVPLPTFARWTPGDIALEADRTAGTEERPERPSAGALTLRRALSDEGLSMKIDDLTFIGGLVRETASYRLEGRWTADRATLGLSLALPLHGTHQPLPLDSARPTALMADGGHWAFYVGGTRLGRGTGDLALSAEQGEGGLVGSLSLGEVVLDVLPADFGKPEQPEMEILFSDDGARLIAGIGFRGWRLGDAELRLPRHPPQIENRLGLEAPLPELRLILDEVGPRLALGKPRSAVRLKLGPTGRKNGIPVEVSFEAVLESAPDSAQAGFLLLPDALRLNLKSRWITSDFAAGELRTTVPRLVFTNRQEVPLGEGGPIRLTARFEDRATSLENAALRLGDDQRLVLEDPLVSAGPVEIRFDLGLDTPKKGPLSVEIESGLFEASTQRFEARPPLRLSVAQRELELHALSVGKITVDAKKATIDDLRLDLAEVGALSAPVVERKIALPVDARGIGLVQEMSRLTDLLRNPELHSAGPEARTVFLVAPEAACLRRLTVPAWGLFVSADVLGKEISDWFRRIVLGQPDPQMEILRAPVVELGEQRIEVDGRFAMRSVEPAEVERLEVKVTVELTAEVRGESLVFKPQVKTLESSTFDPGPEVSSHAFQVVEETVEIFENTLGRQFARWPFELILDFRPRAEPAGESSASARDRSGEQPPVHVVLLGPDGLHVLAGDEGTSTGIDPAEPTFADFAASFEEKRSQFFPALEPTEGTQMALSPAYMAPVMAAALEGWTGRFAESVVTAGGGLSIIDLEVLSCHDDRASTQAQAELRRSIADCLDDCGSDCRARKDCAFRCQPFDVACQARRSTCETKEDIRRERCLKQCESTCRGETQRTFGGTPERCAALSEKLEPGTASAELRFDLAFDYELRGLELAEAADSAPSDGSYLLRAAVLDEAPTGRFELSPPVVDPGDGLICASGEGASRESLFSRVTAPRALYRLSWPESKEGPLRLVRDEPFELAQMVNLAEPPQWTFELSCQTPDGLSATVSAELELDESTSSDLLALPVALPRLQLDAVNLVIGGTELELMAKGNGVFAQIR